MTTTTTNRFPSVAPPPGADYVDDWEGDPPQRVVGSGGRGIADRGHDIIVWTATIQYADGSLRQPIEIHVDHGEDGALTSAQARALAARIIDAADEVDAWVTAAENGGLTK
jgi:hypothetical protein